MSIQLPRVFIEQKVLFFDIYLHIKHELEVNRMYTDDLKSNMQLTVKKATPTYTHAFNCFKTTPIAIQFTFCETVIKTETYSM